MKMSLSARSRADSQAIARQRASMKAAPRSATRRARATQRAPNVPARLTRTRAPAASRLLAVRFDSPVKKMMALQASPAARHYRSTRSARTRSQARQRPDASCRASRNKRRQQCRSRRARESQAVLGAAALRERATRAGGGRADPRAPRRLRARRGAAPVRDAPVRLKRKRQRAHRRDQAAAYGATMQVCARNARRAQWASCRPTCRPTTARSAASARRLPRSPGWARRPPARQCQAMPHIDGNAPRRGR